MGSLTKLINDLDGAKDDEQEQKERLQILLDLAKSKISTFKVELDEGFANPGMINKTQIPGTRSIRYISQYHVATKTEFNSQVGDHLTHAIDAFFSIGDGDNKKSVQEGLKQIIQTGLSGFIGSTEAGESLDRMYFVVPENNAFIRVDVACWKYHFEQHKILNQSDTAVAYVLCKSVIDHTQITLDELIYLVTQALSSGAFMDSSRSDPAYAVEKIEDVAGALKKLGIKGEVADYLGDATHWDFGTVGKKTALVLLSTDKAPATPKKMDWGTFVSRILSRDVPSIETGTKKGEEPAVLKLRFTGNLDMATPPIISSPASLQVVEGYIDEMVRVWKKLSADR